MPEFGRLLSDKYRSAHGLLTSEEIRARRRQLGLSQQQFAQHLGVGVASVKRWEMGKIQEARSDVDIRSKTDPTLQSTAMSKNVTEVIVISTNVVGSAIYVLGAESTSPAEVDESLEPPILRRTVPPHLANLLNARTRD
jgi:transcriptional regulator with XRE-family HTH domain